jgi:formylglycine-generating enzyme required for sulfatase activity
MKIARYSALAAFIAVFLISLLSAGSGSAARGACGDECRNSREVHQPLAEAPAQGKDALPQARKNPRDGADMVLVPAGEFLMGSPEGEGDNDEHPRYKVWLDAYYIYKYEVTNGQFARFINETGYNAQSSWRMFYKSKMERHPVIGVNWDDAEAYCRWAGVRLPTEAEREKAARGTDGRKYPWGNNWDKNRCNWFNGSKLPGMSDIYQGRGTLPAGSFPLGVSPYGVHDMAGNVWEWCSDWYSTTYYGGSPARNLQGPSSGQFRVLRGGSWYNDSRFCCRCANRFKCPADSRHIIVGFRCVQVPRGKTKEFSRNTR